MLDFKLLQHLLWYFSHSTRGSGKVGRATGMGKVMHHKGWRMFQNIRLSVMEAWAVGL